MLNIVDKNILNCLGKIEFKVKGRKSFGSASIVQTDTMLIVATAAHCLYDWENQCFYDNVSFYPYLDNLKTKLNPVSATIPKIWADQGALDYDTGFLVFDCFPDKYRQYAIPAEFNLSRELHYLVIGFENRIIPSKNPSISYGKARHDFHKNSTLQGINSKGKSGMSGGAWITKYKGNYIQNSVTSFSYKSVKNTLWSPYWGKTIESVYRVAIGYTQHDSSVLSHRYTP